MSQQNVSVKSLSVARSLEASEKLEKLKWLRLKYAEQNYGPPLERMEAHTATTILNRFVAVVGGWCNSSDNRIDVVDGGCLDGAQLDEDDSFGGTPLPLVTLPAFTENTPLFRYGFSTTLYKGRLLVLGGCKGGGYSHDCSECYYVDMRFHCTPQVTGSGGASSEEVVYYLNKQHAPTVTCTGTVDLRSTGGSVGSVDADCAQIAATPASGIRKVVARYSANLTPAQPLPLLTEQLATPISRAYHTAVVAPLNSVDTLFVWGGLHRRAPTAQLELCDLVTHTWHRATTQGEEPTPRFGHSCVPLFGSDWHGESGAGEGKAVCVDRLVFTGGSDGNDLVRNGQELREIHVLNIVRGTSIQARHGSCITHTATSAAAVTDVLVWSTPQLSSVPKGLSASHSLPGRCHCAVQVGKRVLYFGGAANSTNTAYALTVPPPPSASIDTHASKTSESSSDTSTNSVLSRTQLTLRAQQRVVDHILNTTDALHSTQHSDELSAPSTTTPQLSSDDTCTLYLPAVASLKAGKLPVPAERHHGLPRARLSAAAALVGRFWLVIGGFSVMHREMGDVWALDTAYGTSSAFIADREGVRQAATHRAFRASEGLDFIDEYEGDGSEGEDGGERSEEEEEDEEEWGDESDGEAGEGGAALGGHALISFFTGGMGSVQQRMNVLAQLVNLGVLSPQQAQELLNGMAYDVPDDADENSEDGSDGDASEGDASNGSGNDESGQNSA